MFGQTYQHDLLRKYSVIFGALFNDISINRTDDSGTVQTLKVPIGYGPKEKFLARVNGNPDGLHSGKPAITLPRLAFEMGSPVYDGSRKLQNLGRVSMPSVANSEIRISTYNPVPYNIPFTLWVMVKNAIDGTRIIEQILPSFKPQYTVEAELLPTMGLTHDIPIILEKVSLEDQYEGSWEKRRQLIWELQFNLKGFLYGSLSTQGLIKLAQTHIFANLTSNTWSALVSVQPGLDANGDPTTDPAVTIPYTDINEDDDWAYIVQIDEEYE